MSNLNHMICLTCGHDFYVSSAYATCDACQTFFYAASSRTSQHLQRAISPTTLFTVPWCDSTVGSPRDAKEMP
jgi:hypothetical protein